ncbi:leucine-rich repeat-containing protein 74B-like isoform X1 [Liolophura sinensis]|uniref:leucine-rich repeat-containing protein 74B-like isoform X1 n=1 Tax=Liolophura sinensis TaxID=3198878 RepID=UPI0031585B33
MSNGEESEEVGSPSTRTCGHSREKKSDINGNEKLTDLGEVKEESEEADGYAADTETGGKGIYSRPATSSGAKEEQSQKIRPPSRSDSTFMTKPKQEVSRENSRLISSRSSTSLRPSGQASRNCPPSSNNRKTVSRANRKSRPQSSGSQTDRFQSSESESETDGPRTRLDAASVSDIEFGGVDITDERAWDTDLEVEEPREAYDHTGKASYIEGCKRLGVIPASYFLRHMNDPHLDMKHHGLGVIGVKAIAVSLVSNPHVTHLNLRDNWLGTEGGVAICEMLRENCFIVDLDLSDNKLGMEFATVITDVILSSGNLTHLTLSGNNFDDSAGQHFAEAIMNTRHLEYLNLSHNRLGEEAGVALGPAISENSSIKHLDLSWNSLRRKGAVCVAMGLKNNVFMKKINLSWNGFGLDGSLALGDALKGNSVLQELDITNNRITAEGAVWIGKGLAVNETLKTLKMATNPMESPGCYAVLAGILRNQSSIIEFLDFHDIQVNKDFEELLQQVQVQYPELKVVHGGTELIKKSKVKLHPMLKLRNYIDRHNIRMIDFFNKFDKDGSLSVSREEFVHGLEDIGIQLTDEEVEILVNEMDRDGDGEINYSELVIGQRDFMEKEEQLQKALISAA